VGQDFLFGPLERENLIAHAAQRSAKVGGRLPVVDDRSVARILLARNESGGLLQNQELAPPCLIYQSNLD
jgi:hypothetical protein